MMQKFEWDEDKNRTNIAKHGIDFEYASRIFNGFTLGSVDVHLSQSIVAAIEMKAEKLVSVLQ